MPRNGFAQHSISVFFPAYNDAPSLPGLIEKTFAVLRRHFRDFEVIIVNDGSHDNTAQILQQLERQYGPQLRIITHPVNRGYGGALRSGFAAATKDLVFYTDGDGQYDPSELAALYQHLQPGVSFVNGYKLQRNDPWHRVFIGSTYNRFARLLFGVRLRDIDCDFRLIRRDLLQSLKLVSTSGTICVELVRKLELSGCGVAEVGVHHYPRLHGSSQFFRFRSLLSTLYQLVRLRVQLTFMTMLHTARHLFQECL